MGGGGAGPPANRGPRVVGRLGRLLFLDFFSFSADYAAESHRGCGGLAPAAWASVERGSGSFSRREAGALQVFLRKFDGDSAYVGMSDGNPELLSTSQIQEMVHSEVAAYDSSRPGPLLGRPAMLASHMSALSQSQLISQMGIRSSITHSSPSPPGSKSATPSPSSSTQEEESEAHFKISGEKRPSADPGKKAKNPKKKKKKDPNEPQKPVSAYALFFRDTQAAIKGQNPSATFGDVSKIVASMWDSLGEEQKQAYKRKTEAAKKEYLKALAAYRASLVSKSPPDQGETKSTQANPPAKLLPPKQPMYSMPGLASFLTPSDLQAFRSGASPASLARTLGSKSLLPGLSASSPPPPSFPLSPPLHQQLPLPPHAQGALLSPPVSMSPAPQPPVLPTPMALQVQLAMSPSPPGPQDFPHISEFPSGSGPRSPGPSNSTSSGDWDSSYPSGECGVGTCRLCRGSPLPGARRKNLQEPSAR
ncbi:TOX high mobility group box family member 2 isoform X3 [Marmota marmota marmota]|uniref:TOX high mobility group box family member 2 isoform X3 n=1 Tax=Marmota marmota marmota TaxID=9994 RepID=UPI002092FC14|nr:TOX high mobility group box family member 2 isoform X3 [Marmota marmota marmota]